MRTAIATLRKDMMELGVARLKGVSLSGSPLDKTGLLDRHDQGAPGVYKTLADKLFWNKPVEEPDWTDYDAQFEDTEETQEELRTLRALQEMLTLARRSGQGDLAQMIQDRLLEPVHCKEATREGNQEGSGD